MTFSRTLNIVRSILLAPEKWIADGLFSRRAESHARLSRQRSGSRSRSRSRSGSLVFQTRRPLPHTGTWLFIGSRTILKPLARRNTASLTIRQAAAQTIGAPQRPPQPPRLPRLPRPVKSSPPPHWPSAGRPDEIQPFPHTLKFSHEV